MGDLMSLVRTAVQPQYALRVMETEETRVMASRRTSVERRSRAAEKRTKRDLAVADNTGELNLVPQRRPETVLEHFRRIYLSMQSSDTQKVPPVIGVTSALAGEGRTTVAAGIAAAMAADLDVPVVLVEANLAQPGLHRVMGIAPDPGVSEYLLGESDLNTALRQISDRLFVLPAGNARGEASRLIRQLTTGDLRSRLDASGAVVVIDLPPVLSSSYGVLASSMAEALAFVVRSGYATNNQVRDALSRLDETMVRGIVLNATQPQLPRWLMERL